jgi:hypothetical protein
MFSSLMNSSSSGVRCPCSKAWASSGATPLGCARSPLLARSWRSMLATTWSASAKYIDQGRAKPKKYRKSTERKTEQHTLPLLQASGLRHWIILRRCCWLGVPLNTGHNLIWKSSRNGSRAKLRGPRTTWKVRHTRDLSIHHCQSAFFDIHT